MGGILWLASFPKSGNTWMRAFLHNLLLDPPEPMAINEIDRFTLGDSQANWYMQFSSTPPEELTLEELARLRPKVHRAFTGAHPDTVFVKTHAYVGESHGVPLITMEVTAGAIYIIRNPLDVAVSFANHFGVSIDEAIEAMNKEGGLTQATSVNVTEFINSWSNNVKSWTQLPNPRLHVVRYEDMLDTPVKTFGKVVQFLGLPPSRPRLQKAIKFSSFRELSKQESQVGFKEKSVNAQRFFRSGTHGQWRKKLTPEQVETICRQHGEQMARFGYLPPEYRRLAS